MTVDLILLHPPTVYDFRKRSIMYGPISDLIPSTPVLEMYPVGFMSIAEHLERNGFSARIVNLAVKMLSDDGFDVERYIKSLDALAFGIDLHWLPHVHGGLEVARIIKNHHDRPVIFGGLSASYFHRELIGYDQVDFVVRGDSTEEPVLQLIKCLSKGMKPEDVPNLVYKDEGKVRVNPFTHVATDIDDIPMGYTNVVRSVVKYRDLEGYKPFKNWLSYPITSVLTCRGCTQNCVTCGGSCFAYGKSYNRKKTAFRSPSKVAEEVASISKLIKGPIFLVGDIRQPGKEHAQNVLKEIKKERIDNQIVVELFTPAPKGFLEDVARCIPNFNIQISPETHDEDVRKAQGRGYANKDLEKTIECALDLGCQKLDMFYMIGLPKQTPQSVEDTVKYSDKLVRKHGRDGRLHLFISPMGPFMDPGSLVFEDPERYGYKLFCTSLEDHRKALESPSWKYILNYENEWMTRDEMVASSYQGALGLNRLKAEHGIIEKDTAERIENRIELAIETTRLIDEAMGLKSPKRKEERLAQLKQSFGHLDEIICEKKELEWPTKRGKLRISRIMKLMLSRK